MRRTKKMIIISILVSLSLVLDLIKKFIPFLNMPSGGSINIALIPIVFSSFVYGIKDSFLVGLIWLITSSLIGLNSYFISFGQIFLDYFIPSTILCLSSLFYKKKKLYEIIIGISVCMFIRTLAICYSGAIYWYDGSDVAGSLNAWVFSIGYNLPYSITTTIMLIVIIPFILRVSNKKARIIEP